MIDAITAGSGLEVSAARNRAQVSQEDFLQILVAELTNQNPMDPMDNAQFLQQLVGLQTLEQTSALTDALKTFERFLNMGSAAGLIGKTVSGFGLEGQPVTGIVDKVVMENGSVLLQVGAELMPMHGVEAIS